MSTIEERAQNLAHSVLADGQSRSCVEMATEALRTERRLVLEQVRDMLDRAIAELPSEQDKSTESIAEVFHRASKLED